MRLLAQIVSWIALAATIIPSLIYLNDGLTLSQVKTWMIIATVVWFVTVPMWMDRKAS